MTSPTAQLENNSLETRQEDSSKISLPELALADKATFGRLLGYDMPKHQEAWCDEIMKYARLVHLAPAGHGKTTIFSIINALHEITVNRSIRIGLVTNTDTLAESIMSEIKWHLENNENLLNFYGDFKPKKPEKWSKWQIQVTNNIYKMNKKDASIAAFGSMSSMKGHRFDLILGDDIVDEKNSKTFEKCDALWDWVWSILIPRLEIPGESPVKFMGTVENESDMYHRFMENNRGFHVVKQQAITDEIKKQTLWPSKMPFDALANVRSANYSSFMKTYQNTVIGSEVAKISQGCIDACYDASEVMYPHHIPDNVRERFKYIYMGVDPAWTKKRRSKYAVIMTEGYTHDGRRQVLDIFREKVEYDQLFGWIKTKYANLRPHRVLVESNNMQSKLAQDVKSAAIPTRSVFTSESKNDIDVGIPMLYSVIAAGKLTLPCGDPSSRSLSQELISEILTYPLGQFSDSLMALYFIEQEIRRNTSQVKIIQESAVSGRKAPLTRFSKRYSWGLTA